MFVPIQHLTLMVFIILFTACGSEDSSSSQTDNPSITTDQPSNETNASNSVSTETNHDSDNNTTVENIESTKIKGVVVDGEISGAILFLDLNRNGKLDANEPNTTTDNNGNYLLQVSEEQQKHKNYLSKKAPIIAYGGVDIRTGEKFDDYLTAIIEDKNETNVTPLTTLISETLGEELDADVNDTIQNIDEKIKEIKENLASLFEIKTELLTKNPIELAQKGDVSLIDTSLQLHKVAKNMKKAMKAEVKELKRSILKGYKAIAKSLKKVKKSAIKEGDTALVTALDNAFEDNELFDTQFKEAVKEESKVLSKEIKAFWSSNSVILSDEEINVTLKEIEVIIVDENNSTTDINNNQDETNSITDNTTSEGEQNQTTLPDEPVDNNGSGEQNTTETTQTESSNDVQELEEEGETDTTTNSNDTNATETVTHPLDSNATDTPENNTSSNEHNTTTSQTDNDSDSQQSGEPLEQEETNSTTDTNHVTETITNPIDNTDANTSNNTALDNNSTEVKAEESTENNTSSNEQNTTTNQTDTDSNFEESDEPLEQSETNSTIDTHDNNSTETITNPVDNIDTNTSDNTTPDNNSTEIEESIDNNDSTDTNEINSSEQQDNEPIEEEDDNTSESHENTTNPTDTNSTNTSEANQSEELTDYENRNRYTFSNISELEEFSLYNITNNDLQNGTLLLEDNQSGDTQINAEDDRGILTIQSYRGDFEATLKYSDHVLLGSGYQAQLGLFLANESFNWESTTSYPRLTNKMHKTIDYSWFNFSDGENESQQSSVSPRKVEGYLRLTRTSGKITASFWHEGSWQGFDSISLDYNSSVHIGVRMFASYQDLYSVKVDELIISTDEDGDTLSDRVEELLGTNPSLADSDGDGKSDSVDLYPLDSTNNEKTRLKSQNTLQGQLFNVNSQWYMVVHNDTNLEVTPRITLEGLSSGTTIEVLDEARSFTSTEKSHFSDATELPAFSSRIYAFDISAYTLPDPTAPVYPSTLTAWVLTGYQQTPTDPDTQTILGNAEAVRNWELSHADMTFGGGYGEENDEMKAVVGYMYNQMLDFNPAEREIWLRDRAEQNGVNYEDFFLHFAEDTTVEVRNQTNSIYTPLYGVPTITGYTRNEQDSGVRFNAYGNIDIGAWDHADSNGSLYVYLFEPFNKLNINLSTVAESGQLIVEYPSTLDANGIVSEWESLDIVDDTNNLSQSGSVSWMPPSDWKRTATYNPTTQEGKSFANKFLANGIAYYVVRLKWKDGSGTAPRLSGLSLKKWLKPISESNTTNYTIPGWDATNDTNGDGFVDNTEYNNRPNTNATARFRYEARAVPLGSMWSEHSSFCRTDFSNKTLQEYFGAFHQYHWGNNKESGAYNDDFFRLLEENAFKVHSGGKLLEYNGSIQEESIQNQYREDFKTTLNVIKSMTNSEWISANTSAENIFVNPERLQFLPSIDAYLREGYLKPSLGLSGYFGVNKTWDNFALAHANKKSVIMGHNRAGRVAKIANSEESWAKDSESQLTLYYMMNVPEKTYFQAWNSSFNYGSGNTFKAVSSYWKAGVPKNYAYQPSKMLAVDIGEPSDTIPEGKEPIKYMVRTKVPLSDYTVIGDSSDTVLKHAEIGESGEVGVVPSHIYYFQRSDDNVVQDGPREMVLARNYTKGLVLYRTDFFGGNIDFMQSSSEALDLGGLYHRVNTDGTLAPASSNITLEGYEGAILVKAEDSDSDGLPDEWETEHGLDAFNANNAQADSDGDGYSDLYEYQQGTNPSDIDSAPNQTTQNLASNLNLPKMSQKQHESLQQHIKLQKPSEVRLHAVSQNWLRLSLMPKRNKENTAFERQPVAIENAHNSQLFTLKDDNNQTLTIDKTGLKRRTVYAPLRVSDLRILENIFIHVTEPLEVGKTYHLEVNATITGSAIQESLSFDPSTQLSDTLHVTPYGFRPNDKKKAYLGLNMGSAGELDIDDLNFKVLRSSDQSVVYEGVGVLEQSEGWRESFANKPYTHVYELDFSTLNTTGEYYIQHATGISQPFTIHSDAYRNGLNTLALGMYHQRRGEALTKPYTHFTHKGTIEDETYVYDSNDLDSWLTGLSGWGNGIKYPTTLEGQKVEISGGHMDAGDYSPYTYNSAMTAWTLITTLDIFGERVAHDNLGLPESGDGISDILQEFLIEINWLKDMQDPVDGGVFGMSKPKGMHYQSTMPGEDETLKRYLAPKDTTVTAGYAAALARAARSPILQNHDSELAELLKERAIKAWEWLAQNEGMHGYHHYGKAHPDGDDEGHEHARAWAAIELYALTGEQKYHDSFVEYHKPLQRDNGVYWMNEGYGYTIRTLALWQRDKIPYTVDENLMSTSLERFRGAMDRYVEQSNETPYDLIVDSVVKRWNVVGWYFPISAFGWDLLVAHELYGEAKYLEVAQDQIHFTLGSNPSNMSYITGMGYKRLKSTVDQESRFDGIEEPVVGLPVSPIVSNYTWSNTYQRDISDYSYPKDNPDDNGAVYGILESAYDGWNVNGEFTIEKMAGMLSSLAILTPKSDEQYAYPEFNLSVTALGNGEYQPTIHFKNGEPQNYTVLWYENNEAVSANPDYILKQDFTNPTWKLSAEVITLEGRRWYDAITVNTRDYNNSNIPLEAFADNSADTLFHFDGDLNDSNSLLNSLSLYGDAHFDNSNVNWMQEPTGEAIRFNGFGDEIKTVFTLDPYLPEGKSFADISEVSIEGLFYFDSLGEVNENVLNLFYLVQSWGNGLQLTRYNWTDDIRADFGKTQNSGEAINNALSLHQWHYIQMIRTRTHDILKIDGVEYVKVEHDASTLFDHRDITLKLGNYYGWADEIRFNVEFQDQLDTSFLPAIPSTLLHETQIETDLNVRYDRIESFSETLASEYDHAICDVSNFWDANRVMIGGRANGRGEEVCKVQLASDDNFDLSFLTKWPLNNIHYPVTPEPAWARFRFPVPQGHVANEIEYEISWYKLFGSSPTNCHPNEFNETTGKCDIDVSDSWKENVEAGLYLFWTTPNADEQVMTGPHAPIEKIGYSGVDTFKAEVPEAYRDVEEVIVTFVAYNQYTKACEKENSTRCTTHENENFRIRAVTLKSEKPFTPVKEPDLVHPRILGNNSEFKSYYGAFDALNCIESAKDMGWGVVFNAKNIWDKNTKGVSLCHKDAPSSISEISDAQYYLNRQEGDSWKRDRALRVMFLLREMMDCHSGNESCLYSAEDVTLLKEAFIESEMARFDGVSWDWGYKCFDIGTEPPVKFWSIFVDVFWNDLESADKEKIDSKLSEKIGCFMDQVENKDWSLFNGNNWTPILDKAALYWAIAYYHEDERAKDVVKEVLRTLWLHRDFYLEDGSYMEGVVEYTNVSYSNLREINNLIRQSFGEHLASVRWERTEKTSRWYLDFMATDGRMADFGDSWDKRGWSTFDPLHMMLWEEMIGSKELGSVNLDACSVQEYFSNVWFVKGFDDPWSVQPSMARDWQSIVDSCNKSDINKTASILFDQAESVVFKSYIANATNLADEESMRFSQANYTWLGLNGVPNDFPHRELDFGALIWTAYGNRLLHDFGYGEIGKTSSKRGYLIQDGDLQLFDNLALGANTLVVEDATIEGYTGGNYHNDLINSSQIYGARGEVEAFDLNGHKAFVADGSAVYGRDDAEFGWLAYFFRYMVALEDGNFMVIDTFKSKDERGDVNVKEYWHSSDESNLSECVYSRDKVVMGIKEPTVLTLKPLCSMLNREANSTVSANIIAASLQEGAFEIEPESIHYKNRNGTEIYRKRAKYGSLTPVSEDIRVFLLQASPNAELPNASVTRKQGDALSACFDVTIAGATKALKFKKVDGEFKIDTFAEGRCPENETSWVTVSQSDNSATFSTIQAAFDSNANNILIKDGTYRVNTMLEIARDGVEIKGESRDGVVIEAFNMSDEVVQDRDCYDLFHVDANHVTVSNLTLKQNPNCKNTTFVTGANHHVVLKDSHLIGSEDMFTIFYAGPHHVNGPQPLAMFERGELDHNNQVLNNIIDSTYWGDVLSFSMQKDGNVSGNTLNGGLIALFLDDNVTCEHNTLNSPEARGIAISLPSKDVFVRYNTITNSKGAGISTSRQSDYQDDIGKSLTKLDYRGTGIIIEANEVVDSRYHGIEVSNIKSSVIKNNDVTSTAHSGIYIVYSDELLIYKNRVTDSNLVASGLKDSEHAWNPNWDSAIYFDTNVTTSRVSLNTIIGNNGKIQRGVAINPYNVGNTNSSLYWNSFEGGFMYEKVYSGDASNRVFENDIAERTGNGLWLQILGEGNVTINSAEYNQSIHIPQDNIQSYTIKAVPHEGSEFIGWNSELGCEKLECTVENTSLLDIVARFQKTNE